MNDALRDQLTRDDEGFGDGLGADGGAGGAGAIDAEAAREERERARARLPAFQVLLVGSMSATPIRSITAADVNRLIMVPGIVINASRTRPKAITVAVRCRNCGAEKHIPVPPGFGGAVMPRQCTNL